MIDPHHCGIGDQLARDGEFVIGQASMKASPAATASMPQKASTTLWRVPEKVTLAQPRSAWRSSSAWPPPSSSKADSSGIQGVRLAVRRAAESMA